MRTRLVALAAAAGLAGCNAIAQPVAAPIHAAVDTREASAPDPEPAPLVPMVERPSTPVGFGPADEFEDVASACVGLVDRLVDREDLRPAIRDWCLVRAHASSRNGRVRSRIDGSWIHDRDRPVAKSFYLAGLRSGAIDPDTCTHHRVDTSVRRSREAAEIVDRWPYGTHCDRSQGECRPRRPGKMLRSVAERWLEREPDYERFGTRGPMDNNFATAARYIGGCFGPEQLDRFDVSAAVVIERAEDLCMRLERRFKTRAKREAAKRVGDPIRCRDHRDIREIWSPRFWAR